MGKKALVIIVVSTLVPHTSVDLLSCYVKVLCDWVLVLYFALAGSSYRLFKFLQALPWAIIFCPFQADLMLYIVTCVRALAFLPLLVLCVGLFFDITQ